MLSIRTIEERELHSLASLYSELIDIPTDVTKMAQVFNTIKNNENYVVLGAFNGEELLGSLMGVVCLDLIGDCKPFMVIENVIVSARARRQGAGKQLMRHIEQVARDRNCWYMILVSGETRKEAHLFYERLGFKEERVQGYRKHLS
ncbi:MAG: GNAT family N-acetyltransferase [Cohnella sp.]|nr:GNAT family N-acetyltransferase [Cohnella sp.]